MSSEPELVESEPETMEPKFECVHNCRDICSVFGECDACDGFLNHWKYSLEIQACLKIKFLPIELVRICGKYLQESHKYKLIDNGYCNHCGPRCYECYNYRKKHGLYKLGDTYV
jgi:hypothetical protein